MSKQRAEQLSNLLERRRAPIRGMEIREESTGELKLSGYASVFDAPYDMGFYTEVVRSGAFTKTLAGSADVQLLVNHEGLPLARTASGTLTLTQDAKGLKVEASLDPADPDVDALRRKMARGDIDEMSMAFWVKRQSWNEDYTEREILEVSLDKGDVSIVNYGANPATAGAALRSRMPARERRMYFDVEPIEGSYEDVQEDLLEGLQQVEGAGFYIEIIGTFFDRVIYKIYARSNGYVAYDDDGEAFERTYVYDETTDEVTFGDRKPVDLSIVVVPETDVEPATTGAPKQLETYRARAAALHL